MAEGGKKRHVNYIENNVYEEAKLRIKHIIQSFDSFAVCFSGGKDSLVAVHLTREVMGELGIEDPLDVVFRDEELIPDDVIEFVLSYAAQTDKYRFHYYAVPLKSEKFILGNTVEYIQWDETREWIRPKPDIAITDSEGHIFDQYSMDDFVARRFVGKLALINGIRTDESLMRLKSVLNKKNECYIAGCKTPRVSLCKPLYDWSENDVFKYFYDNDIKYCQIYDLQVWNNQGLRVSTPLHAESSKRFFQWRSLYPKYYQQLIDLFPEMLVQERYWGEYDREAVMNKYEHNWNGVARYIREEIKDKGKQRLAFQRVLESRKIREANMKIGKGLNNFGGYPVLYVFKVIIAGQYKRSILPCGDIPQKFIDYENVAL